PGDAADDQQRTALLCGGVRRGRTVVSPGVPRLGVLRRPFHRRVGHVPVSLGPTTARALDNEDHAMWQAGPTSLNYPLLTNRFKLTARRNSSLWPSPVVLHRSSATRLRVAWYPACRGLIPAPSIPASASGGSPRRCRLRGRHSTPHTSCPARA